VRPHHRARQVSAARYVSVGGTILGTGVGRPPQKSRNLRITQVGELGVRDLSPAPVSYGVQTSSGGFKAKRHRAERSTMPTHSQLPRPYRRPGTIALTLLVLLGVLGATSSPAGAAGAGWGDRAEAIAADYWAQRLPEVSCDSTLVEIRMVSRGEIGGDGLATHAGCLDLGEDWEVAPEDTVILISRRLVKLGWIYFCSVAIHEYGHLLGLEHTKKPGSIMNQQVTGKALARKECG
jgi:hypothetical protein